MSLLINHFPFGRYFSFDFVCFFRHVTLPMRMFKVCSLVVRISTRPFSVVLSTLPNPSPPLLLLLLTKIVFSVRASKNFEYLNKKERRSFDILRFTEIFRAKNAIRRKKTRTLLVSL